MTTRTPRVTPESLIQPGSAQKRPGPREQFGARVASAVELTPKAAAQAAKRQAESARIAKAKATAPPTRDQLMGARMYPGQATPEHVAAAKRHGAIIATDKPRQKIEPGWNPPADTRQREG